MLLSRSVCYWALSHLFNRCLGSGIISVAVVDIWVMASAQLQHYHLTRANKIFQHLSYTINKQVFAVVQEHCWILCYFSPSVYSQISNWIKAKSIFWSVVETSFDISVVTININQDYSYLLSSRASNIMVHGTEWTAFTRVIKGSIHPGFCQGTGTVKFSTRIVIRFPVSWAGL